MTSRKAVSGEVDGATAVAHKHDTIQNLTTTGAKLISIKNAGVEKFSIDKDGLTSGSFVTIVKPSEGGAGIQAALNAISAAGGGIVQLLLGTYSISSGISVSAANNVMLRGIGDGTILDCLAPMNVLFFAGTNVIPVGNKALNNITAGDTSIFTTTPGDAAPILTGDFIRVIGTHSVTGDIEVEFHEAAAAGNPSNGEIQLVRPTVRTLTSAGIGMAWRDNNNNSVKDLKITNSSSSASIAINSSRSKNFLIDNVTVDGNAAMSVGLQIMTGGDGAVVQNCKVQNTTQSGLQCWHQTNLKVQKNLFLNTVTTVAANPAISVGRKSAGVIIKDNFIDTAQDTGIETNNAAGGEAGDGINSRFKIVGNIISNTPEPGIELFGRDFEVVGNQLSNTSYTTLSSGQACIRCSGSRISVIENIINTGRGGINFITPPTSHNDIIVSGNIISNTREYGIQFSVVEGGICNNNRVINLTTGSYALLLSNCERVNTVGNIFTVVTAGGRGIYLVNDSNNNIIANNVLANNSIAGIDLANDSDGNVIIGNLTNGNGITQGTGSNTFVSNID